MSQCVMVMIKLSLMCAMIGILLGACQNILEGGSLDFICD